MTPRTGPLAPFGQADTFVLNQVRDVFKNGITTKNGRILSSNAATPSGRCRPSGFGMYTLREGLARYAPL